MDEDRDNVGGIWDEWANVCPYHGPAINLLRDFDCFQAAKDLVQYLQHSHLRCNPEDDFSTPELSTAYETTRQENGIELGNVTNAIGGFGQYYDSGCCPPATLIHYISIDNSHVRPTHALAETPFEGGPPPQGQWQYALFAIWALFRGPHLGTCLVQTSQ
ncbi:hypothetical protein BC827DRAFT_1157353 [Russula dissimulans]|nr:hypothetical protein BC827DRAFT_1157353 [Russula dissimulans]